MALGPKKNGAGPVWIPPRRLQVIQGLQPWAEKRTFPAWSVNSTRTILEPYGRVEMKEW